MSDDLGNDFRVILADPPWPYDTWSDKGKARSQEKHYRTMKLGDIYAMGDRIEAAAAPDCCLFLWATGFHLPAAIECMYAWGFSYKALAFVWIKTTMAGGPAMGLGKWTRQNAELCLLGTRGRPSRERADVHQIVQSSRRGHSVKPDEVQERIEKLVAGPYLELFARRKRDGWTTWGDEL